jgi:hypothetical protein
LKLSPTKIFLVAPYPLSKSWEAVLKNPSQTEPVNRNATSKPAALKPQPKAYKLPFHDCLIECGFVWNAMNEVPVPTPTKATISPCAGEAGKYTSKYPDDVLRK